MERRTIYAMFQETAARYPDRPAVGSKTGKATELTYLTYAELDASIRQARRALDALGLKRGDAIALLSEGRPEWAITDLAAQSLGLILVAPYTTLPPAQIGYIVRDSGAKAIIISDLKQLDKVVKFRTETPELAQMIVLEGDADKIDAACAQSWEGFLQQGAASERSEAELDALTAAVEPDDTATLIYTSGTTGEPKGAMLSHLNLLQTPDGIFEEGSVALNERDVFLSFLPLSHISERVGGHYIPLRFGACIVYSQDLKYLKEEITATVRPTAMICVPRLWTSFYDGIKSQLMKEPPTKRKIAEWALKVGQQVAQKRSDGKAPGLLLSAQYGIAQKLALAKIRAAATGGNLRYCVSGGAPLDNETATFFLGIGIQILEGYGLSETNIIAINRPHRQRIGTVGNLMPAVEFRIADDGEFLMRGQGRMQGYHNKPDATAEAIDTEGWFHTGDIGELSPDGYVKITDRKKDLLVLTNGKKVAPQPIEADLRQSPYIGEAVLLGDKQPTVSALLVPDFGKLLAWAKAKELPTEISALAAHPDTQKLFKAEVDAHTRGLADYEKIKRFKLLEKPFSIETGELTPTLKVKRKVVAEKYAEAIAAMSR